MSDIPNHVYNSEAILQNLDGGVERRILSHSENLMVCELFFPKGASGSPHTHVHEQATYVVSGVFEFTVDGEKVVVRPGDTMYFKPDVLHGCVCLEAGVIIDIFTPERKDFLA